MNITAESSAPHVHVLENLPPATQAWLYRRDDELVMLRGKQAKAKQRGQHAGSSKAGRVQAAIRAMAQGRELQLAEWTGSNKAKCEWLRGQIKAAITNNNGMWNHITRPPHWTTISKVIKKLRM